MKVAPVARAASLRVNESSSERFHKKMSDKKMGEEASGLGFHLLVPRLTVPLDCG